MKVLITAPSLDENRNVSGISTVVRAVVEKGNAEYIHFAAGRGDGETWGSGWIGRQVLLPFRFRAAIRRTKPEVVHLNTSFEPRAIVRDLALLCFVPADTPVVLHIHGGRYLSRDFETKTLRAAAEKLVRSANRVIVIGEKEKLELIELAGPLAVDVLPNAVDTSGWPERTHRAIDERVIIYFGRLHRSKGLDEIVEICRGLMDRGVRFRFACFGTGPDEKQFIERMSALLGDRFFFGGVARGERKAAALGEADIFLLPSKFEGLPMALLEAMAAGCVPVVSSEGMMGEVVQDGANGFLIDPDDAAAAAAVAAKVIAMNDGELGRLRENAQSTVSERFSFDRYITRLENIYTEVLQTH